MRAAIYLLLAALLLCACGKKPAPKQEKVVRITLPPPPVKPPPPTPPPVQEPPEQKVVDQKQTIDPDPKPMAAKPEPVKPPDESPPSMGSNIKGNGSDGFGLSGSGNGGFVGVGGKGNGGGSRYAAYLAQVQGGLASSLRQDKRTRAAAFDFKVRVWLDSAGKVTRAEAAAGNDSAAANSLVGQRIADGPPDGLPMPILAHLAARRPN